MVSYEEALREIRTRVQVVAGNESVPLGLSQGRVLADSLKAARPNPAFDNSAVDGYLLGSKSACKGDTFELVGEIRAGSLPPFPVPSRGQAVRIFTGAPKPDGDFCIAMQEDVRADGSHLAVLDDIGPGANVRLAGADFKKGVTLVPQGRRMGPAEIALAAWSGLSKLKVFRKPRVATLVTGDEIVPLGGPIEDGQIYDSNGPMLQALVARATPAEVTHMALSDSLEETKDRLAALADSQDALVLSGGASVGDYDHVPAAVAALGSVHFHKVSIKPGKPVLFGQIRSCMVFGLPGNPASAFVCFELFVAEALRILAGEDVPERIGLTARYSQDHSAAHRDEFVRVRLEYRVDGLWADPHFEQGSFGLRSLSNSHGFARLRSDRSYRPGDPVEVMLLPGAM